MMQCKRGLHWSQRESLSLDDLQSFPNWCKRSIPLYFYIDHSLDKGSSKDSVELEQSSCFQYGGGQFRGGPQGGWVNKYLSLLGGRYGSHTTVSIAVRSLYCMDLPASYNFNLYRNRFPKILICLLSWRNTWERLVVPDLVTVAGLRSKPIPIICLLY